MLFMFFNLILAQVQTPPPPPPGPVPVGLPIDNGLMILFVAALIYGVYKVIKHKKGLSA